MNRPLLWITMAVLGAAATVMTSWGLIAAGLFLVLTLPLILRADRVVALSGLLSGFGGFWTLLIGRQFASGATTDDAAFWIAVGIVPLVAGCALLALVAGRSLRSRVVTRADPT
jgi:hypothetical protein